MSGATFSAVLPLIATFSRRLVVVRPILLRLMKIVLPKRHLPPLRLSFTDRFATVVRCFLTVSLTLPLHEAPADSATVPRARMRTRLPTIFAVAPPLGNVIAPPLALPFVIWMVRVASATFPALSANVTLTV